MELEKSMPNFSKKSSTRDRRRKLPKIENKSTTRKKTKLI